MATIVLLLSVWIFIRTLSYGIYEIKQNSNKFGGIVTIAFAILSLILPNLVIYINGFAQ